MIGRSLLFLLSLSSCLLGSGLVVIGFPLALRAFRSEAGLHGGTSWVIPGAGFVLLLLGSTGLLWLWKEVIVLSTKPERPSRTAVERFEDWLLGRDHQGHSE